MISKEEAKEKIKQLVREFSDFPKEQLGSKSENQIKSEFIDPLFEALGWDMRKDAERETQIFKGRADYIIRNGNQEVLILEAKKTSVSLTEDEGRQAVSYSYHRKIKFSVLTNFKYIRVYHALSNIKRIDANLLFWLDFKDFENNFDKLWLLSKESFEKKELEKLIPPQDQKKAIPIDKRILEDLLQIREWLSKELKDKRTPLSTEQIDEIVQIMIDRLIFMRSVEDRKLEAEDFLLKIMQSIQHGETDKNLWALIKEQFTRFNNTYDSKLFSNGILEEYGFFSDDTLKKVIKTLYYGLEHTQEKYMFNMIPGDLFGSIYEQYLGTILSGTEKRVKLEGKTGKRKKMGIYYTPSYIVDYIVKNTVYEYIKDKTIDEILDVNILDPACGSGSFITRAFVEVCNVVQNKLENGEKSQKWATFKEHNGKLNFSQKSTILKNCIYGVDLDEKAVELAQLNLLLKCLEGETRELKNRKLPNLLENIQCGNSLIDDPTVSDRAFKWQVAFKDVMNSGGFDVVIGNPPYVRIQTLNKEDLDYFNKNYESPEKNYDIYILFVEKGYKLLKKEGTLGYILPNKFFSADYGKAVRNYISKNKAIKEIVDFKDYQIFESATTYTCLLFLTKENKTHFNYCFLKDLVELNKGVLDKKNLICSEQDMPPTDLTWSFSEENNSNLFNKLNKVDLKLSNVTSAIFQGMVTGADRYYFVKVVKEKNNTFIVKNNLSDKEYEVEKNIVKKLLKGKEIRRWIVNWEGWSVLYPYDLSKAKAKLIELSDLRKEYPLFFNYLKDYERELKLREGNKFKEDKNWHKFGRTQNIDKFKDQKIMTQVLSNSNKFTLDEEGEYYFVGGGNAGGYGIILKEEYKDKYRLILGLLNSNLLEFYVKNISTRFRGGYYSYAKRFIERLPIKFPLSSQENKIISLVNQMLELQKKYHEEKIQGHEKERLKQQIDNVDYEINDEVYDLYEITEDEKKIIEESLK